MFLKRLKQNIHIRRLFNKSIFTADNIKMNNVSIGEFTYGKPSIYTWTNNYNVKIGKFCSIAEGVKILVDGNHRPDWISTYPFGEVLHDVEKNPGHPIGKGDMEIGNDVWIGMDAMILSGVSIGNGAVIAAGSVVTKNVLPYEIVGGNPAKSIKFRFTDEQIKSLEKIAWWNWNSEKVKSEVSMLQSGNIDDFIKKHLSKAA